jgi:hypothetical protein
MGKFTTLAISQEDHLKLKIISAKLNIPMMKLLHQWIAVGCIITETPVVPNETPAKKDAEMI